jgi:hypothetical protein
MVGAFVCLVLWCLFRVHWWKESTEGALERRRSIVVHACGIVDEAFLWRAITHLLLALLSLMAIR